MENQFLKVITGLILLIVTSTLAEDDLRWKNEVYGNNGNESRIGTLAEYAGYGDPCDGTTFCNPAKHFECSADGKCWCKDETNIYDRDLDICLVLANGACREIVHNQHPTKCINFAYCDQVKVGEDGKCVCDSGTEATADNFCKLSYGYGECARKSDCATGKFLDCGMNKTCVCDQPPEHATWEDGTCKSLFGGLCTPSPADPPTPEDRLCAGGTSTMCSSSGICDCNASLNYTSDIGEHGTSCKKDLGAGCNIATDPCHSDFTCTGGICGCNETEILVGRECRLRAGQPCSPAEDKCEPSSSCGASSSICECLENHEATDDGICKGKYGAGCTEDSCLTEQKFTCNATTNGFCDCITGYSWSTTEEKCVGQLSGSCADDTDCYSDLVCSGADENSKTCSCFELSRPSPDGRTCFLDYGATCPGREWECNTNLFLTCNAESGSCGCSGEFIYDQETNAEKCLVRNGFACSVNGNRECAGRYGVCTVDPATGDFKCGCMIGSCYNNETELCGTTGCEKGDGGSGGMGRYENSGGSVYFVIFAVVAAILKN